jgi:autotransporter-associated beta strand protein
MKILRLSSLLLGSSLIVCTASAHAADVIKANNTTALNVAGSWVTAVPSSSDVALWNNTVTAANTSALGGSVSWQGIRIANPGGASGAVTINGSAGATLTLGSAGIDMSAASQNLTVGTTPVPILLSANQTWNIGSSRTLTLSANGGSGTNIDLNGTTLGTSGAGNIVINNKNSLTSATAAIINVNNANFSFESGSSTAVSIASNITTNVASGKVFQLRGNSGSGIPSVGVNSNGLVNVNGGIFRIASSSGVAVNQTAKVSLATGSTLDNTVSTLGAKFNLTGELAVAGSTTWNESGANANTASTFSGPLTGSGTLDFKNTSAVAGRRADWSGNNTGFTGTVNINGSSGNRNLRLTTATAGSSTGTWAPAAGNVLEVDGVAVNFGTLNGAGTVTNSHATSVAGITVGAGAFSGAITNGTPLLGMSLTKTGIGTLALTGANTYTGLTTVTAGTLNTTTNSANPTGSVIVEDAGTFGVSQLANGATFNVSTLTMGSTGNSTLQLTPAAAPSAALVTAGTFTVNGATTLRVTGLPVSNTTLVSYTSTNLIGTSGLNLVMPFRINGTINNTGSAITLTGVQDETPKWRNGDGVWDIDTTGNWNTTTTSTTTNYLEGGVGATDSVIFDDTSSGTSPITVTLNSTVSPVAITVAGTTDYIISGSGAIAGTAGITKSGSAALTLATANTFSGSVLLNQGTLNINNATALGSGTLTIAGGTVLNNTSGSPVVATNAQNWNGDFTFTGSSDLTLGAAAMNADRLVTVSANTLSVGAVTGAFGLTKAGAGTLAVGAGSTYSGATAVNAGVLKAAAASAFSATSVVTLADTAGVALDLNGFNQTVNTITGGGVTGGNVVLGNATLTTGSTSNTTFSGALSGAGGLTKIGSGTFTLAGSKGDYTGTTSISGGTLDVGTLSGAFGTGNVVGSNTVFLQGNGSTTTGITGGSSGIGARGGNLTVNVGGAGAQILLNSSGTNGLGGMNFGSATSDSKVIVENGISINNFNSTRTFTVNTGVGTASAEITGVVANGTGNGDTGIVKAGTGDLILSNANTITGSTSINAGRIVLGHNQALQFTSLTTDNVGSVSASGFTTPTIGGLTGSTALGTFISSGYSDITSLTLAPQTGRSLSYSGVIADGATGMNLVKSGAGTQTLNATNTYTGSTTISGGTLKLGTTGSLAAATKISIAAGGIFDLRDLTLSSGTYTWNAASLSASGAAMPATIAGTVGGNVDLGITPITLTHNGTNAPLTVSGSGLSLAGNQFTVVVPGPALTAGVYTLVSGVAITGTVNSTPSYLGGNGVDSGLTGVVSIDGGNKVILTVTSPSGFGTWITGFGLAVSDQGPNADPDNDGISNLVEYAIDGQDPTVPQGSVGTFAGGMLSFTKRALAVSNGDLVYAIEESDDLGISDPWAVVTPGVNDGTTISYTLPTAGPKLFARLKVTTTP